MNIRLKLRSKLLLAVLAVIIVANLLNTAEQIRALREINSKYANEIANNTGEKYAPIIYKTIDEQLNQTRELSKECNRILDGSQDLIVEDINKRLKEVATANPELTSVWASLELKAIDPTYTKNHGRVRFNYYRENGILKFKRDSLELDKDNTESLYYKSKIEKSDMLTDPYWYSYNKKDSVLESSIASPILKGESYRGLVGFDVSLESFQRMIKSIDPANGAQSFLISANGSIIAASEADYRGKQLAIVYPQLESKNFISNIAKGETTSFEYTGTGKENYYFSIFSVKFPTTNSSWGIGFALPLDELLGSTKDAMKRIWYLSIFTFLLVVIVISFISHRITKPLLTVSRTLKKLAAGDVDNSHEISINTKDEIKDIATSTNLLIQSLNSTVNFAKEVGKGNLNVDYKPQSENDTIGIVLLEMKKNLEDAKNQENIRRIEDEKINWSTKGTALFGELLRHNESNLEEFSYHILSNLIEYVKADVGGLFLINEHNDKETTIDLMASYAYDRRKYEERSLFIGEGLVGRCVQECETIFLTEIPQGYISIGSGLGENDPTCILIVPLKLNDEVYGVIELATFEPFEKHVVEFVEKIGVTIASTISTTRVNIKTKQLLEASKFQAEELASQEEEMRQNMEELIATQEEAARKNQQIENLVTSLNTATYIIEYDLEGNVILANNSILELLKMHREAILGMNIKDIDKYASLHFDEFWNDLKRAIPMKASSTIRGNKKEIELFETFIPISDEYNKVYKIMVILQNLNEFVSEKKNKMTTTA